MESEEKLLQLTALVAENEALLQGLRDEIEGLRKTASPETMARARMFTEKLLLLAREQLRTAKAIVELSQKGR